ncbi:MAG: AraC family transcriptional regulator [Bacteroidota bacterium]
MLYLSYTHTDYYSFLADFAKSVGTTLTTEGSFDFPPNFAKGYNKVLTLPNGLQAIIIDAVLNDDFCITRNKSADEFYALRFDEFHINEKMTIKFDKEHIHKSENSRSAVMLTSSLFDYGFILKKGSVVKGINVLMTKEWLAKYLGISSNDKVIQKYLALKTASINLEPFDTQYRQLFNTILEEEKKDNPLKTVIIQNRIMLLIERFFTRLYKKMETKIFRKTLSDEEIQRLMNTEAKLVKDFSLAPPTIPQLAKKAVMSETKLKTLFKKVYGSSIYEYYQKNRMIRARYLLESRKYSVKEVGMMLNFKNLSNFTIAFKKEFGILPSNLQEELKK